MFDWEGFFRKNRIAWVTTGPNASRGHLQIKCPFCGSGDPSEHMGVSVHGEGYHCWRNKSHGGRSPVRLVQALLHCDTRTAREIVYGDVDIIPTQEDLAAKLTALRNKDNYGDNATSRLEELHFPREFRSILNGSVMARPFLWYLYDRGYSEADVSWLADAYRLQYATKGAFHHRIIIPFYDRDGNLETWTGRSIRSRDELRYKALGMPRADREPPFAKCATKETLLGLPVLWGANNAEVLVLVEGPFDAFRIVSVGRGLGVYATCLSGLSVQVGQLDLLYDLSARFRKIVLILDPDADLQRLRFYEQLSSLRVDVVSLPGGAEDPGELSTEETLALCVDLLSRN